MTKWYDKEEENLYTDFDDGLMSENELSLALDVLRQETEEARIEAAEMAYQIMLERE